MKECIGKFLVTLGSVPGFKSFVIGLLLKYPKLMDYIDAATEIYKGVQAIKDERKGSESSK